jgi:single-stranded-DNA-specific exonuclease
MAQTIMQKWMQKIHPEMPRVENWSSWELKNLPNFSELIDLTIAAETIAKAVAQGDKIAIWGDYDVDGTTSCAVLYKFFQLLQVTVHCYQPSRFTEGYGLHPSSVEKMHAEGVRLIITVDCGIGSHAAALKAHELDVKLIITDHHQDSYDHRPKACAVINPNRADETCDGRLKNLAGVGVAFALCVEIRKLFIKNGTELPSLYFLLPYVAIGTIADVASLNPMNLVLCRHGLKQLLSTKDPGLKQFMQERAHSPKYLEGDLVGFNIGPLINSKGRLEHAEKALELLTTASDSQAQEIYMQLKTVNAQRKKIQQEVYEQACKEYESENHHPFIVVYDSGWHEGVIGIVASKLSEEFKKPTLVFTNTNDDPNLIKASCRTFGFVNIYESLKVLTIFF